MAKKQRDQNRTNPEFWTTERCFITELMNDPEQPGASLAIARVEPKTTTQLHYLSDITECYIIRKGEGILEIDGDKQKVSTGDRATIGPNTPQRIQNCGEGDLEFYCLCTPRFTPDAYVNLEDD